MRYRYHAMVIGCSFGGLQALETICKGLQPDLPIPIMVAQHLSPDSDSYLATHLNRISKLQVMEAEDKQVIEPGKIYTAPANYHLMVEEDYTLSLSIEERVNYSRPSIDVLFDTAAEAYGRKLIGLILTGANNDGSLGLKKIKKKGGLALVQDPQGAEAKIMPAAAINVTNVDHILPLEEIAGFINDLYMR